MAGLEAARMMILNTYKETGNTTNFYMNMENLEKKETKINLPINRRRFGRRKVYEY